MTDEKKMEEATIRLFQYAQKTGALYINGKRVEKDEKVVDKAVGIKGGKV